MFVEMTSEAFVKLEKRLKEMGVEYAVTDCTMENDSIPHVHVEFGNLSKERCEELAKEIDLSYGEVAELSKEPKQVRRRKWDEKMHTPGQEALGYLSGESTKEDVTYE